jgi:sortase A
LEGVRASDLKVGIGHIPGTAGLGEKGNCVLAGHRNYTFGRFFNRLDEVEEGDIILITTKKAQFKYKVNEKLVVLPDDVSVIKGNKDETILTLVTCTPIYIATHRLIIHASLEETALLEP